MGKIVVEFDYKNDKDLKWISKWGKKEEILKERCCGVKVRFLNSEDATEVCKKAYSKGGGLMAPYKCKFCGFWHIGHDKTFQKDKFIKDVLTDPDKINKEKEKENIKIKKDKAKHCGNKIKYTKSEIKEITKSMTKENKKLGHNNPRKNLQVSYYLCNCCGYYHINKKRREKEKNYHV